MDNDEKNTEAKETRNLITELGVLNLATDFKSDIQYLNIIGCIEGHTVMPQENKTTRYEHIIPQLIAVEENPEIKGLLTILNTVGGDVEAGLAIAEIISTLSKPTVSLVIGGGHSIGIPLAVASDYTFIAKSATMTLHPIRVTGLVIGAEPTFDYFRRTQERVVEFIVEHSESSEADILKRMNSTGNMANDVGMILFGHDAVNIGLIDEVGGLKQAIGKLRALIGDETREYKRKRKKGDKHGSN